MRILQTLAKIPRALRPRTAPAYSVASTQSDVLKEFEVSKEDLKLAYLSHPIVNRAIHFRADLIVARGFSLEFSDDTTKEIITEFLHDMKLNSPIHADLKTMIRNACIDCDVFGNAFYHLIPNQARTKIVKLAPLHPVDVDFQRDSMGTILLDSTGEPKGYVFRAGSKEERFFKREEVAHLRFETLGDELLGIPLLLPMFRTLERLSNVEFAIAQSLYKHGLPTRSVSVGDPDHPPTAEDIEKVADQVRNLDSASEYVHPYYFKVDTIETKFPSNIQNIPEFFLSQIVALSGIPRRFLLGEEKFASTVTALQRNLAMMLEPLQVRVKTWVEEQIFQRVLAIRKHEGEVKLIWRTITEPAEPRLVDDTVKLARTFIDGKPLITWEEARQRLKLPTTPVESRATTLMQLKNNELAGIYLVEPHGELIWLGRKKAIVKSVKFSSHIGEPLYLLSGKLCYGIIRLDSPFEISLKEFRELIPKHLVSEEEREKWWPNKRKLYYYPIVVEKLFNPPLRWKHEPGVQNFVHHVEFD